MKILYIEKKDVFCRGIMKRIPLQGVKVEYVTYCKCNYGKACYKTAKGKMIKSNLSVPFLKDKSRYYVGTEIIKHLRKR